MTILGIGPFEMALAVMVVLVIVFMANRKR